MHIEVVYALRDHQHVVHVELVEESSVRDALGAVSRLAAFAGLDLGQMPVGIFGRIVDRDEMLKPGDRVELYRPLVMDPRQARRIRSTSSDPGKGPRN